MVQHEQSQLALYLQCFSLMLTLVGSWKGMKTEMVSEGGTNAQLW